MASTNTIRNYFVDEAGDGTLFTKRGKVILGDEGCSNYFILGVLDVNDVEKLTTEVSALRAAFLADPYFKKVPSMLPEARKTYFAFHAKDDVPEVRKEVFSLISKHDVKFMAVVRDKRKLLDYVRQQSVKKTGYRYHPDELYDYLVRRLFKNLLHKDDAIIVTFAKRGDKDRTERLKLALEQAKNHFEQQWNYENHTDITVVPDIPQHCVLLQVVDYFLWSLQRFYEKREDRYLEFLWPQFRMVNDLDDTRKSSYGVYYDKKRPLTLAAFDDF